MDENRFASVISKEFNRKVIETLYEYPFSSIRTLTRRITDPEKYTAEQIKKYRAAIKKNKGKITEFLGRIKELNYFVDDGYDILYPANMFPTGRTQEWLFYKRTYIGLNSVFIKREFPDTPETIFKMFNGRLVGKDDILSSCEVSRHVVVPLISNLVDAEVLERKKNKATLKNEHFKKIAEWHERKSEPLVKKDEETSVFVKELRKLIGKTAKITPIEKDKVKYYNVEAGGESVNLCTNPMGRYLSWIE